MQLFVHDNSIVYSWQFLADMILVELELQNATNKAKMSTK